MKRTLVVQGVLMATVLMAGVFTFMPTSNTNTAPDVIKMEKNDPALLQKIADMGGLQFVMPAAFAQLTEDQVNDLVAKGRKVVEFSVYAKSVELPIMGGTYKAMTFNEQVPGPTLRVTQGDIVKVTITIPADEKTMHGIDMHASQMSAKPDMGAVEIGKSRTYYYIADVPGTFKYHCSGVNVAAMDQHVLSGMYGMTIVDPLDGYRPLKVSATTVKDGKVVKETRTYSPDALEFQLHYNQLYLDSNGNYDMTAMLQHHHTQAVVNGMAFGYVPNEVHNQLINGDKNKNIFVAQPWNSADLKQYQSQLLFVPVGEHVRFFVENSGNEPLAFHIVGEVLDQVTMGNRIQAKGVETWDIGGSQGAIIDVVFDNPGVYVAVNHDYAQIFTGTATVIVAGNFFKEALRDDLGDAVDGIKYYAEALGNPSDSIPPAGKNSLPHPKVNLHGLYTDERAAEIKEMMGIQ